MTQEYSDCGPEFVIANLCLALKRCGGPAIRCSAGQNKVKTTTLTGKMWENAATKPRFVLFQLKNKLSALVKAKLAARLAFKVEDHDLQLSYLPIGRTPKVLLALLLLQRSRQYNKLSVFMA